MVGEEPTSICPLITDHFAGMLAQFLGSPLPPYVCTNCKWEKSALETRFLTCVLEVEQCEWYSALQLYNLTWSLIYIFCVSWFVLLYTLQFLLLLDLRQWGFCENVQHLNKAGGRQDHCHKEVSTVECHHSHPTSTPKLVWEMKRVLVVCSIYNWSQSTFAGQFRTE